MSAALSIFPQGTIEPRALPAAAPGLYVHIPFCFHKCHYCDFYSITGQSEERKDRFVSLLLREADQWRDLPQLTVRPRTVFFGGGTPTLLPVEAMRRLIDGLKERFDFSQCDEWTVEANPATVTDEYCRMLRELGVNRLSFGAQSFDRAELAALQRHHDPDDVPRSVETARAASFSRLNLDLIYAICGQSLQSWGQSLESAIALKTEHLSCYGLTFEPNTPLGVMKRLGRVTAVAEELELEMAGHARRRLAEAGLAAYEISNFSRPRGECRHNLLYWTGGDYLGLGPSAASHVQGTRWKNGGHLGQWEAAVADGGLNATNIERLSLEQRAGELAMLEIRLVRGLRYADFEDVLGLDARPIFAEAVERLSRLGLVQASEQGARLTERGWAVADSVAAELVACA